MGLFSGLFIGAESLYAHSTALNVVADNLANSNTFGYKAERAEFGDLLAQNLGNIYSEPNQVGDGSMITTIGRPFTQGSFDQTGRPLDIAIQGNGFFVVNDGNSDLYTRAGNFTTDAEGNLVTAEGFSVLGLTAASPDTPVPLSITSAGTNAIATTTVTMSGNLNASEPVEALPAAPTTFQDLQAGSDYSTFVSVIDSLGAKHDITLHFYHTAVGTYDVQAYVDAGETGGVVGTPQQLGTAQLAFDATGLQNPATPTTISVSPAWANGSAAGAITLDLSGFSGFAAASTTNSVTIDGLSPGSVTGYEIDESGAVLANFDNGTSAQIGTLAIATFNSVDGLERVGQNKFSATEKSGTATAGAPDSEGRGSLVGGTLEQSNVDASREFIDMIRFQRGYQAGSQIISTMNDVINTTLQLA